ncbi:MAG: MYG1 family protein [Candidatus Bathyarchaeia archaeon]
MEIITHSGHAHADEFLAISLLLYKFPNAIVRRVEKVGPSKGAILVDIGGKYKPPKYFDHHQDPNLPASFVLILKHFYNIDYDDLPRNYQFYDSKDKVGIGRASREWDKIFILSPVETTILKIFSERSEIRPGDPLHNIMIEIGRGILKELNSYITALDHIKDYIRTPDGYILFLDDPDISIPGILERFNGRVIGIVKPDSRNPQYTDILSVGNNPIFRPSDYLEEEAIFTHKSGFLRSVKMKPEEAWSRLKQIIESKGRALYV